MSVEIKTDEDVPKLPRGRGLRFSKPELFRIALTLITLVGVVMLAKPCADAVSGFVMRMDEGAEGSAGKANQMPKPGTVDEPQQFEHIKSDMTEEEQKAAIERAMKRASGSGTGSAGSAGGP